MGQAKQKQYSKIEFLKIHQICCYCGEKATTIDHCPPRSLFIDRKWPESYEFPSCERCNSEGRKIENIIAVIYRIRLNTSVKDAHLGKLIMGLRNNSPEIIKELESSNNGRWHRQELRKQYGDMGDDIYMRGYRVATIDGPKMREAMEYFGRKMGKALYYKHIGRRLKGKLFTKSMYINRNPELLQIIANMTPMFATLQREFKNLSDQFTYRFNYNADLGIFCAIAGFKEQLGYLIMAMDEEFYKSLPPDTIDGLNEIFDNEQQKSLVPSVVS